jgi:hypothetical protein
MAELMTEADMACSLSAKARHGLRRGIIRGKTAGNAEILFV